MNEKSEMNSRNYLSTTEVAEYLGLKVKDIVYMIKIGQIFAQKSTSGQYRISFDDIKDIPPNNKKINERQQNTTEISFKSSTQKIITSNAQDMREIDTDSVHLIITSPPYFNAKMYSNESNINDLGNIHNLSCWFNEIEKVWSEVYRVLAPGRKFFLNIMNLPIKEDKSFRTLNLVGKSIDLCENIGFIFKRDIIWHKTNGVRAHFGTYHYPGGILINNMHESIMEFQKPEKKSTDKYKHLTTEIKEKSKIDKDFWLSIKNSDVWLMKPENSGDGRNHVAPFPYELPYRLIKAYSFIGETILDPFCGSGTTLIAARDLERNGIGVEINPDYIQLILNRLVKEQLSLKFM
jgi:excisionase family DNA binding protein